MRTLRTLGGSYFQASLLFGQTPVSTPAECPKNVSFAVIAGGQPVAAIPSFVLHSIGSDKHQQRYPGLCFAQSPDPRAKNYVGGVLNSAGQFYRAGSVGSQSM